MTPKEAYKKCLSERRRISELENIIAFNSIFSYRYALNIIQGPWEKGEESISQDPRYSCIYASNIIRGPWELGEESIKKNCLWSFNYARYVIQGSFEKCHPIIFNSEHKDDYIDLLNSINYDMNKISEWLL